MWTALPPPADPRSVQAPALSGGVPRDAVRVHDGGGLMGERVSGFFGEEGWRESEREKEGRHNVEVEKESGVGLHGGAEEGGRSGVEHRGQAVQLAEAAHERD
eukprot:1304264-Rhodomonas_salina.1